MSRDSRARSSPLDLFRTGREEPRVHALAALAVAAYAWTLHGLIGAILTLSTLIIAIALTNIAIAAGGGGAKWARISRWAWLLAVLAALVIMGRPDAERDCRAKASPFWSLLQLAFCDEDKETVRRAKRRRPPPHEHLP